MSGHVNKTKSIQLCAVYIKKNCKISHYIFKIEIKYIAVCLKLDIIYIKLCALVFVLKYPWWSPKKEDIWRSYSRPKYLRSWFHQYKLIFHESEWQVCHLSRHIKKLMVLLELIANLLCVLKSYNISCW